VKEIGGGGVATRGCDRRGAFEFPNRPEGETGGLLSLTERFESTGPFEHEHSTISPTRRRSGNWLALIDKVEGFTSVAAIVLDMGHCAPVPRGSLCQHCHPCQPHGANPHG
jgi:hypothetical protein